MRKEHFHGVGLEIYRVMSRTCYVLHIITGYVLAVVPGNFGNCQLPPDLKLSTASQVKESSVYLEEEHDEK